MLNQLQALVRKVAEHNVMPYFLKVNLSRKKDGSVFSEADLSSQEALSEGLKSIINCPVLAEEMSFEEQQELWMHNQKGLWIVDPIDGSNNFVNGIPHFAISVAYIVNGFPQLGVIFNPVSNECFYAEKNKGSWMNGIKLPLKVIDKDNLKTAIAGVDLKRVRSGELLRRLNTFAPYGSTRMLGSSTLDWCYLAAGRYDIYIHGGQKLWDYAAGVLIFEEAGGQIAGINEEDSWENKDSIFTRSFIAGLQKNLFEKWLSWVRANQY